MKPLKLKKLAPIVVRHNDWNEQEDGSLRCGNVLLRCDDVYYIGDYRCERWYIYRVEVDGKLTRVHPKSRPWGYGHSGAAKIGANLLRTPVAAPPTTAKPPKAER